MGAPTSRVTVGEELNGWTIIENLGVVRGRTTVQASCRCGNIKTIAYAKIKGGFTRSCGCEKNSHLYKLSGVLTQQSLKSILSYDADTGYFTWLLRLSGKQKAGDTAGCIDGDGYVVIGIGNKNYKASVLAWLYVYGRWPILELDHINRIRNDNRVENLREATKKEQQANKTRSRNNTSGYTWVREDKERGGWLVQSKIFGFAGRFKTKEEAIAEAEKRRTILTKEQKERLEKMK